MEVEKMGIERIGGGGAINVSTSQKVSRPEIQVADMAQSPVVKNDNVAPVTTDSKSGYSQQGGHEGADGKLQSEKEISPEKVKSAVDDINKQIKSSLRNTQCSFKYHEDTNRISITVTDKETDEVIREIPPEKALDMLAKAWELAGLMVDERR